MELVIILLRRAIKKATNTSYKLQFSISSLKLIKNYFEFYLKFIRRIKIMHSLILEKDKIKRYYCVLNIKVQFLDN